MLTGLGQWLRIAGYDTAIAERGRRDRDLVEQAHAEQRILLTRDRRLVDIRRADERTVVLESDGIDACAREIAGRLALDWTRDPLSRCSLCNAGLEWADHRLLDTLPHAADVAAFPIQVAAVRADFDRGAAPSDPPCTRLASFAYPADHREETQAAGELDRPGAPL
jgi:hypothetical protein